MRPISVMRLRGTSAPFHMMIQATKKHAHKDVMTVPQPSGKDSGKREQREKDAKIADTAYDWQDVDGEGIVTQISAAIRNQDVKEGVK